MADFAAREIVAVGADGRLQRKGQPPLVPSGNPVPESVIALTVTTQASRHRNHASFGC